VNFIVSYHGEADRTDFLSKMIRYKDQLLSVSYMFDPNIKNLEDSLKEYKLFENILGKEIVFWPAINPLMNEDGTPTKSESVDLIDKDTENMLIGVNQNHFSVNSKGDSTFKIWKEYGFFVDRERFNKSRNISKCSFMGTYVLEIYNNRIFRCPADLHINTGIYNYENKLKITEYPKFLDMLIKENFLCKQKKCIAFDHNYMTDTIKGLEWK
jgi:hypothetical protein